MALMVLGSNPSLTASLGHWTALELISSSVKWVQHPGGQDIVIIERDNETHIDSVLFHSKKATARKAQHLTAGSGIRTWPA